ADIDTRRAPAIVSSLCPRPQSTRASPSSWPPPSQRLSSASREASHSARVRLPAAPLRSPSAADKLLTHRPDPRCSCGSEQGRQLPELEVTRPSLAARRPEEREAWPHESTVSAGQCDQDASRNQAVRPTPTRHHPPPCDAGLRRGTRNV